jgi:hypothetical protein
MAAVAAVLAMTVGAARADTVLPDNGSVEFYDSTGEATFNLSGGAELDYSAAAGSYYYIQATFLLYDVNGNQIALPLYDGCYVCGPVPSAELYETVANTPYLGPDPVRTTLQYAGLPDGYYTVVITSSTTSENLLSPLTYTLTGDICPITPIPAALPLFATSLGLMSLFGWRRKRKASEIVDAA